MEETHIKKSCVVMFQGSTLAFFGCQKNLSYHISSSCGFGLPLSTNFFVKGTIPLTKTSIIGNNPSKILERKKLDLVDMETIDKLYNSQVTTQPLNKFLDLIVKSWLNLTKLHSN